VVDLAGKRTGRARKFAVFIGLKARRRGDCPGFP
jgi:hypothetical protein